MNVALRREFASLHARGIRVRFLGSRKGLDPDLCTVLSDAEQATQANQALMLNVCFNYGGRWDIVDAAARLAAAGTPITEASMNATLSLAPCSDPDLLIRTGDEHRLSNFLLWQCAYSELYFSPVLWPDFDAANQSAVRAASVLRWVARGGSLVNLYNYVGGNHFARGSGGGYTNAYYWDAPLASDGLDQGPERTTVH